jgi:hypothetical protein
MKFIKYSSNCRYFFGNDVITFVTKESKFKIKASETEYLAIHHMLGEIYRGMEEESFRNQYKAFSKLIIFLEKLGVIYTINASKLNEHKQFAYFQMAEMQASNVEETLDTIKDIQFVINSNFMAQKELALLLQENNLSYQIQDIEQDEDLQLKFNSRNEFVNTSVNDFKEIVIAPLPRKSLGHLNKGEVSSHTISPGLLAAFVFYSSIDKIITEKDNAFIINDELEVKRKEIFDYEDKENNGLEDILLDVSGMNKEGIFDSLNALELFVENYSSKIISFNKDERYGEYSQLPLQVFTVQHYDVNDQFDNIYFADFSYERLGSFLVEIGFNEILKRSYGTAEDAAKESNQFTPIQVQDIPEYEAILDLINDRGIEIDLKVYTDSNDQYFIYIQDHSNNKLFTFDLPITDENYIPLAIYTFISARENNVALESAAFTEFIEGRHFIQKVNQLEEMKL